MPRQLDGAHRAKLATGIMVNFAMILIVIVPLVFFGMVAASKVGCHFGRLHLQRNPKAAEAGGGAVDAAMFALLGLLVAFTFSGAAERFNGRRALIVEEANAIGTAYLRIDLLPEPLQPNMRAEFRRYIDDRIDFYRSLTDMVEARADKRESEALQQRIWHQAVAGLKQVDSPAATTLLLSALNAMIDITSTRMMSLVTHPPPVIYVLLCLMAIVCALLAGFGMAGSEHPSRFHMYGFAAIVTLTVYLTIDLEFPRHGLIRVDAADQLLIELRDSMK